MDTPRSIQLVSETTIFGLEARQQEVPFLFILSFRLCFFFCMSWSNPLCQCNFSFSDWHTLTLLCLLSFFFHSFFLPVAWAIDLAVQGCKYHCGFFHSCPSTSYTYSLLRPFTQSMLHALSHCVHILSCWHLCCPATTLHPLCAVNLVPLFIIRNSQSVVVIAFCTWQLW